MKVGVLALQGAFREHMEALERCSVQGVEVRGKEELDDVDALIIPGGESTTISKLIDKNGLRDLLVARIEAGMPVWGTCAGAILLAREIRDEKKVTPLGVMEVEIERNSYGRQLESFEGELEVCEDFREALGEKVPGIFIRAPRIIEIGDGVKEVAKHKEAVVMAKCGKVLITTFHPELTEDLKVLKFFLSGF